MSFLIKDEKLLKHTTKSGLKLAIILKKNLVVKQHLMNNILKLT